MVGSLQERGLELEALSLARPTLDDVFLELTGRHLEGAAEGDRMMVAPFALQTRLLAARFLLMTVRDPMVWLPNLIFTVVLLLVYDGILGEAIAGLTGGNHLNFLVPVIILSAALAGGHAGFALVTDKETGFFRRQLPMPLSRTAIVLGRLLQGFAVAGALAAVMLAWSVRVARRATSPS